MAVAGRQVMSGSTERVVELTSDGQQLRGILHVPSSQAKTGVVFLNAGLIYRAGPHRLYVKAARRLCAEGFACLRFDFPGVGESDGDTKELDIDLFSETSHTVNAVSSFIHETGVEKVVLVGMCTGSRNAVRAARNDPRVGSLILLSMPVTFDRSKTPIARLVARHNLGTRERIPRLYEFLKSTYLWSVALKTWSWVLVFGSGYRRLKRAARTLSLAAKPRTDVVEEMPAVCADVLAAGTRVLFVYAQGDETLISDFQRNVGNAAGRRGARHRYELRVMDGAGHVFAGLQTQETLIDSMVTWLKEESDGVKTPDAEHATVHASP